MRDTEPLFAMAADVADLVPDDAFKLLGCVGLHDEACVNEHVLAGGSEGVQRIVLHDVDADVPRLQAGGFKQRVAIIAQDLLDLGVADQALGRSCQRDRHCQRTGRDRVQDFPHNAHTNVSFSPVDQPKLAPGR